MIIKVCGMRDSRNIQEVSALAVNWIGLIFYERSPRFIGQSPTKQWTVAVSYTHLTLPTT